MSIILNIETATTVCSVALTEDGKVIVSREKNEGFSHSEKLTVFISEVLSGKNISVKDLDAIAVSSGPGSYTGLRIGISVAKGLCLSQDLPLIGISTLEAMAFGGKEKINTSESNILFCPMIDARRMEVYCALYDSKLNCVHPSSAIVISDDLFSEIRMGKKIYYFGDGAEKCKAILNSHNEFIFHDGLLPSAKFLSELAFNKFKEKDFEDLALFEPVYLKEYKPGVGKRSS